MAYKPGDRVQAPVIWVDFDGVLAPYAVQKDSPWGEILYMDLSTARSKVYPAVIRLVDGLQGKKTVLSNREHDVVTAARKAYPEVSHWAVTTVNRKSKFFAADRSLLNVQMEKPTFDVAEFLADLRDSHQSLYAKLETVVETAELTGRPVVWIDDELRGIADPRRKQHLEEILGSVRGPDGEPIDFLLVDVDGMTGLQPSDFNRIYDFQVSIGLEPQTIAATLASTPGTSIGR